MAKPEEYVRRRDRVKSIRNILAADQWQPHMAGILLRSELERFSENRKAHGINDSGAELLALAAEYIGRSRKPEPCCYERVVCHHGKERNNGS